MSYENETDVRTALLKAEGELIVCDKRRELAVNHSDRLVEEFGR